MPEGPAPRRRVALHKLPVWLQYAIALLTAAVVAIVALAAAGGDEGPDWIGAIAAPALGVLALLVIAGLLITRRRR